ncbi:hypothetical protein ABZ958_03365 [Streptomyces sp. NPDC046237]|uniref:hypothetical protein n=1 Tax=Streptomyces sp. NPDC046237 TaxID=3154914 RepID=UPI0033C58557
MTARKPAARKKTTAARRKPVKRTAGIPKPRTKNRSEKLALWAATTMAKQAEKHTQTVMSRKDAAILRMTHEGCPRCKGNGQIFTKGKDGSFTGSKPCPAKPTKAKVSRMRVALAARFGADKNTGLVGWTCPCGTKEKPRYRDAKEATKALRTHERKKHGGKSVGGAWYGQVTENAPAGAQVEPGRPPYTPPHNADDPTQEQRRGPVEPDTRNPHSGLTDAQWLAQGNDRPLLDGECPTCQGTTYVPIINFSAVSDYERQVFTRCTACVAGRATTSR